MNTNKEELLRQNDQSEKLCIQLLSNRWQAVGFTILLVSGFWTVMLSKSFDVGQSYYKIYFLFFLGCSFSIIVLFLWRYVNHLIKDEEIGYRDGIIIRRKLIADLAISTPSYCDDQLRNKIESIQENELKYDFFLDGLNNEFDKNEKPDSDNNKLFQKFFNLSEEKRLEFSKKNLKIFYPKRFEKGQRDFDLYTLASIIIFAIIGIGFLYLDRTYISTLFNDKPILICGFLTALTLVFFWIILKLSIYIFSNFWERNSKCRIDEINTAIDNFERE